MTGTDTDRPPRRELSLRLLGYILLVSSAVTLLLTAWQLWTDYQRDLDDISDRFAIIEQTTLEPLANSVWALNESQINLLLAGMVNLDSVTGVELATDQGTTYRFGQLPAPGTADIERRYPLVHVEPGQRGPGYALGTLSVYVSLDLVRQRLLDRTANILLGQALKTFIVSVFILVIVQRLVTRHLATIADYARSLSLQTLDRPLVLGRHHRPADGPDELDQVEAALNFMRESLLQDIAGREEAERRLQQSEARYRQLFDASIDGLAIFDPDGHLLTANRAFLDMIGYSLDEARTLSGEAGGPGRWLDAGALTSGRDPREVQQREYVHRDGHAFPVSIRSWVVRDAAGHPQFLTAFVRDVSRERQLDAERARLEQRSNESQRLETVGTLAAGVAHDFNNLLTPIRGYAEMMLKDAGSDAVLRSRAEAIFHAAERGRKLVESILLFSRGGPANPVVASIAQLVADTLALAAITRPPGVKVRTDIVVSNPEIRIDPARFHQLLMNLAINAFDAMAEGGELLVEVRDAPPQSAGLPAGFRLRVSDTGKGIPADAVGKIFDPFFTTRERQRGSGLGLAVVHGIVKSQGGEIAVESSSAGTTFTLWLPRQPPAGNTGGG